VPKPSRTERFAIELSLMGRRPVSLNQERAKHYRARIEDTKWWREGFCWAAIEAGMPRLEAAEIVVQPILNTRKWQDTAACFPSAKAAIDGLVDAGVLDDDTPDILPTITFKRPVLGAQAGLKLTVIALQQRVSGEEAILGIEEPETEIAATHANTKAGGQEARRRGRPSVPKSRR
jgi:hypothetical protein